MCCTYLIIIFMVYVLVGRYNCNRYDEEEAKRARDAQEVDFVIFFTQQNKLILI